MFWVRLVLGNRAHERLSLLTSTKANSRNVSKKVFSKTAKSKPSPFVIGGLNVSVAMPPSPKLTTPLDDAGPMAESSDPTEANPESGRLTCLSPLCMWHLEAQFTKQDESALMAVEPGFPAAGANCANAVLVSIQQRLNNNKEVLRLCGCIRGRLK